MSQLPLVTPSPAQIQQRWGDFPQSLREIPRYQNFDFEILREWRQTARNSRQERKGRIDLEHPKIGLKYTAEDGQ